MGASEASTDGISPESGRSVDHFWRRIGPHGPVDDGTHSCRCIRAVRAVSHQTMMALLPFITGAGLYLLKPWAWKASCLGMAFLIVLGLLNVPRGIADIVIHASLLRFLLGSGTRRVFQADYQDSIRRTPLLQSQPASWGYILMATVTVLLAFAYGMIRR